MRILPVPEIQKRLRKLGPAQWEERSPQWGVPYSTVAKIAYGHIKNPGVDKVIALSRALDDAAEDNTENA